MLLSTTRTLLAATISLAMAPALSAEPPPDQDVYISTFHAKPGQLTVPIGTTVHWHNYDEISHDISFADQVGDRIWTRPWNGATVSRVFEQPGEYSYRCSVHKDVNGRIVVEAPVHEIMEMERPAYAGQTTASYAPRQTTRPYLGGAQQAVPVAADTHAHTVSPVRVAVPASGDAVSIHSHAFHPAQLHVLAGTTVSWTNADQSRHALLFGAEQSAVLSQDDRYERRFDEPGEYAYQCGIHAYMKGTIVVSGS